MRVRISRSVTLVDGVFVVGSPKNGKGRTISRPAFPHTAGGYMPGEQCAAAVVVAGCRGDAVLPSNCPFNEWSLGDSNP